MCQETDEKPQGKFVLTAQPIAQPINHGPVDALTVGTVADPTMRVAVGRATVPASQIEMLEQRVHERTTDLQQANKLLETLSITDGLTGLYNRRYFDEIYTWKGVKQLDSDKKSVLREFYIQQANTREMPVEDIVVSGLIKL